MRTSGRCSTRTGTALPGAAKARRANSATWCWPHRAGSRRCCLEAPVSWRTTLTIVLLVAALVSGWSVWRHRALPAASDGVRGRPDYLLHVLALVALEQAAKESFPLSQHGKTSWR